MGNRWPGKYVIGLTGNIATGKSVVRKMLEHLGAFTIDADALSHQAIGRGGPAYAAVAETFGKWVLTPEGDINRPRLGRIVFADPDALAKLESLIHPFVKQATDLLINRSKAKVAVIEAIKLIETGTAKECDTLWVVHVPEAVQEARLREKRKLSATEAKQRIAAQPPQSEKLKLANIVIDNSGSFEDAWTQVQAAFGKITSVSTSPTEPELVLPAITAKSGAQATKEVRVRRGKPSDASAIANFIKTATLGQRALSRADVIAAFGDKAYMLADYDGALGAIAGFKVENLVSRVDEVYIAPGVPMDVLASPLLQAVENASRELQCEAALAFFPMALMQNAAQALHGIGYAPQVPEKLGVDAWREAARESMPAGTGMLYKKLREDRVLRPV
ncbi:MAG: dephospho-CoA kinase [Anaerolineales bacterium]